MDFSGLLLVILAIRLPNRGTRPPAPPRADQGTFEREVIIMKIINKLIAAYQAARKAESTPVEDARRVQKERLRTLKEATAAHQAARFAWEKAEATYHIAVGEVIAAYGFGYEIRCKQAPVDHEAGTAHGFECPDCKEALWKRLYEDAGLTW